MTTYRIGRQLVKLDGPGSDALLAAAHSNHVRPSCLCRTPEPPMYVARVGQAFIVKRMPNTGALHDPGCESYEPPAELSGLGEVAGSAIQEDTETGTTALKLDFSLVKLPGRPPAEPGPPGDTVKAESKKLTLRGFLHYLWDQAGFNRWTPSMEGKRNWRVVQYHLTQALANKETKRSQLSDSVYIPEPFQSDRKAQLASRRSAKLAPLLSGRGRSRPLMIVIGEVAEMEQARYGYQITVRHLPDYPFLIDDKMVEKMLERFQMEVGMWRQGDGTRLVLAATFGIPPGGRPTIEEATLMATSETWIPVEDALDNILVRQLVEQRRQFVKGLRYNMANHRPLASAVVMDTKPKPVALYLVSPDHSVTFHEALVKLVGESAVDAWFWNTQGNFPALPAREGYVTQSVPSGAFNGPKAKQETRAANEGDDELEYLGEEEG